MFDSKLDDVQKLSLVKDEINNYFESEINSVKSWMQSNWANPRIENSMNKMYLLLELAKNWDPTIIKSNDNPIRDIENRLINKGELWQKAVDEWLVTKYLLQTIDSMYWSISTDFMQKFGLKDLINEQSKASEQSSKQNNKRLRDLRIDWMKEFGQKFSGEVHKQLLEIYDGVRKIIETDPKYIEQYTNRVNALVKQWKELSQAHNLAVREINDMPDIYKKISSETQTKITDYVTKRLWWIGSIVWNMAVNTAHQMKTLSDTMYWPHIDKNYFQDQFNNIMIEKVMSTTEWYSFLGEVMNSLNSLYKTSMLWFAPGRLITEWANALYMKFSRKYTYGQKMNSWETFSKKHWIKSEANFKLPETGIWKIKELKKHEQKFFSIYNKWNPSYQKQFLQKVTGMFEKASEKTIWFMYDIINKKILPKIFATDFYSKLDEVITFRSQTNPDYPAQVKRLLTATDLTPAEKYSRSKLLNEVVRMASKETKTAFFDYMANPVFVANMERYIPFSNFLYNSARIFSQNPVFWITSMNFANKLMMEFTEPQFDLDGEDMRWYVNMWMFALPIFNALWFGNVGINLNRLLPIDMTDVRMYWYAYQKLFFPTNDSDFKRYLEDKDFKFYELWLKKLIPTAYDLASPIFSGDWRLFAKRAWYLFTWFSVKDTTKLEMLKQYYKGDYDSMMEMNKYAWNQFNIWRKANWLPSMTKDDVMAKKHFDEYMFGDTKSKEATLIKAITDVIANEDFLWTNAYSTDPESIKLIRNWIKWMVSDLFFKWLYDQRNKESEEKGIKEPTLFEKALTLSKQTIKNWKVVEKGEWDKSIIEMLDSLGTMKDFLWKLQYYADNGEVISNYWKAQEKAFDKVSWTKEDLAMLWAFRYKFEEEDKAWQELEKKNPKQYILAKQDAILKWVLKTPMTNDIEDDMWATLVLTDLYRDYMMNSKWIIMTDIENQLNKVRTYNILINIAKKNKEDLWDSPNAWYYSTIIKDLYNKIDDEWVRLDANMPAFKEFDQMIWAKTKGSFLDNFQKAMDEAKRKKFTRRDKYNTYKQKFYSKSMLNDPTIKWYGTEFWTNDNQLINNFKLE
jgi:hypothetical protein